MNEAEPTGQVSETTEENCRLDFLPTALSSPGQMTIRIQLLRKLNTADYSESDVYAEQQSTAAPIQTYNIAWGIGKKLKNDASFGSVISVLYRKSENKALVQRNLFDADAVSLQSLMMIRINMVLTLAPWRISLT